MVPKPDAAPAPAPAPEAPTAGPPDRPTAGMEFSIVALKSVWPQLVEAVKADKRLVGTALADTHLVEVSPPLVAIALKENNPMHAESLERHRDVVERHITARVGAPVRLEVRPPEGVAGAPAPKPKRRTDASDRAEKLQQLRTRDPALDAVAEALDLEMTD